MPNMAKYAKYAYLGAYLAAPNMVKWGVPVKILQNAVQMRWFLVNIWNVKFGQNADVSLRFWIWYLVEISEDEIWSWFV